ncbi:extracellular salicylate hydroxylase/monooxygenase [Aspergillus terreus]|uniref:Extracellular salicylate hydroxylase/monooxygenase n=1 Tax=Aspergillus terreus TaxID=33178 RepID=A0A5M3ZCZ3_ASPTE|nr:hypothetical protein ATETN484_0016005400 [Aspergillus terreus]GFF21483.1 extracellular salicylate hydroxylase/monooxygenase [Aspergillus terreus]
MKIVIVGGGIAGCAAYLELKKHLPPPAPGETHSITIYEAYDTKKDTKQHNPDDSPTPSHALVIGGGLAVGANGLNVVKRLDEDLLRDIVRGGYTLATSNIKNKNGRLLVRMSNAEDRSTPEGGSMHMVGSSRHLLWQCFRQRIPDHDIVTKRVVKVVASRDGRNKIYLHGEDDPIDADLVIGADGVKGIAKRALFPDAQEDLYPPHYEGLVGVGGFIPTSQVKDFVEPGSGNFILGGNGFFGYFFANSAQSAPNRDSPYHVSEPGDTLAWWSTYAVEECPNPKTLDKRDVARQLRERHLHWQDPVIQRVLNSLEVENLYPTWTSPQLPTWARDGVVLVGDAAHALPPSSGQGASQALEDVESLTLLLCHYLREQKPANDPLTLKHVISTAAKQYMHLRRPRIEAILDEARRRQNQKRNMGWLEEMFMYCFMWILGIASKPAKQVFNYNIADEVAKLLASDK